MGAIQLSADETHALRVAIAGHDENFLTGRCECGFEDHNEYRRLEHLLEIAFRSGELFAIMGT